MSGRPVASPRVVVRIVLVMLLAAAAAAGLSAPGRAVTLLSSGYVTPLSGDTATRFTWRVKYWNTDGVLPDAVKTCVWCSATGPRWYTMWALEPGDTDPVDGKWYTLSLTLAAGSYAHRFAAQTGAAWVYWPQPAGTYASGPSVTPPPAVSLLSSGYVTPSAGDTTTRFTWRIKYWNTGGVLPDAVKTCIWSNTAGPQWYTMWALDPSDANPVDGKWYTLSLSLAAGSYAYRFAAQTGVAWTYWPADLTYQSGPTVTALVTSLTGGLVNPTAGTVSSAFTYRVQYWDTANRPPDTGGGGKPQVLVAIWWESQGTAYWYPMSKLEPSDTNYQDGCWYTVTVSGLDVAQHKYRFAAQTAGSWTYWPEPAGDYALGPDMYPPDVWNIFTLYAYYEQYMEAEDLTGLMSLFRSDYLSNGMTKADKQDEYADFFATHSGIQVTQHVSQIAFAGDEARITLVLKIETDQGVVADGTYDDWYGDELGLLNVCKRDTGVWRFYGRQP